MLIKTKFIMVLPRKFRMRLETIWLRKLWAERKDNWKIKLPRSFRGIVSHLRCSRNTQRKFDWPDTMIISTFCGTCIWHFGMTGTVSSATTWESGLEEFWNEKDSSVKNLKRKKRRINVRGAKTGVRLRVVSQGSHADKSQVQLSKSRVH